MAFNLLLVGVFSLLVYTPVCWVNHNSWLTVNYFFNALVYKRKLSVSLEAIAEVLIKTACGFLQLRSKVCYVFFQFNRNLFAADARAAESRLSWHYSYAALY